MSVGRNGYASIADSGPSQFSIILPAGNIEDQCLALITWYGTQTLNALTCGGVNMTLLGSVITGGPGNGRCQWATIETLGVAGTRTITATWSAAPSGCSLQAWRISGGGSCGTPVSATGNSASPSVGITTAKDGSALFVGWIAQASVLTPSAGYTGEAALNSYWNDGAFYDLDVGDAGAKTASGTVDSGSWLITAIELKADAKISRANLSSATPDFTDIGTSVSRTVGTVSAGQLVVCCVSYMSVGGADTPVASDLTRNGTNSTATVSEITLDTVNGGLIGVASEYLYSAIYSCVVLTGGTLQLDFTDALAGSYLAISSEVYNGRWDSTRVAEVATGGYDGTNTQLDASVGMMYSEGHGLFVALLSLNNGSNVTITADPSDSAWTKQSESGSASHVISSFIDRIVPPGTNDEGDWSFTELDGQNYAGSAYGGVVYRESAFPVLRSTPTTATLSAGFSSASVAKPSGIAVGDLMVAIVAINKMSDETNAFPTLTYTGWNLLDSLDEGAPSNWNKTFIFTRVADGSEGANISFACDNSPATDVSGMCAFAFQGHGGTGAKVSNRDTDNDTTKLVSALTTTKANSLALRIVTHTCDFSGTASPYYWGSLSEIVDMGSAYHSISASLEQVASPGDTGTKTVTATSSCSAVTFAIEIKAEGAGPFIPPHARSFSPDGMGMRTVLRM